jgi:hypothetical protein
MIFHPKNLEILLEIFLDKAFILVYLHCSFIGGKCVVEFYFFQSFYPIISLVQNPKHHYIILQTSHLTPYDYSQCVSRWGRTKFLFCRVELHYITQLFVT